MSNEPANLNILYMLPGPQRMLNKVWDALRNGASIVLVVPNDQSFWIVEWLKASLTSPGFYCEDLEAGSSDPLPLMFKTFVDEFSLSPGTIRDVKTLCESAGFEKKIIHPKGIAASAWKAWRTFLEEHAHINRNIDSGRQSQFIVSIIEDPAFLPPKPDIKLEVLKWEGICSRVDAWVYYHYITNSESINSLAHSLKAAICSELALWDLKLCDRLAVCAFQDLMSPQNILKNYGVELSFDKKISEDAAWRTGAAEVINGVLEYHSAYLVFHQSKLIEKRLWRAQLAILFPYIEEQKNELVEKFRDVINLPIQNSREQVEKYDDLEIGHIAYQFRARSCVRDNVIHYTCALNRIRNELAHGRPISLDDLHQIERSPI